MNKKYDEHIKKPKNEKFHNLHGNERSNQHTDIKDIKQYQNFTIEFTFVFFRENLRKEGMNPEREKKESGLKKLLEMECGKSNVIQAATHHAAKFLLCI